MSPAAKLTRRAYLIIRATEMTCATGPVSIALAIEAVDSTALAHPDWDMGDRKTWDEWEAES